MARYYPIIKINADVEIKIYTKLEPTIGEWATISAIFRAFSKWLTSADEGKEGTAVSVKAYRDTLIWSFALYADKVSSSAFPYPFSNWVEDEERWDDNGRYMANREETLQTLRTSICEYVKEVTEATEDVEDVKVRVEIHGVDLCKNVVRVKD